MVLEKVISHPLLKEMVRACLCDFSTIKHNDEIVKNLKSGMLAHLVGVHPSHVVMAKYIVSTLASSQSNTSNRGVAKVLGVDRRNLIRGQERRIQLDTQFYLF